MVCIAFKNLERYYMATEQLHIIIYSKAEWVRAI